MEHKNSSHDHSIFNDNLQFGHTNSSFEKISKVNFEMRFYKAHIVRILVLLILLLFPYLIWALGCHVIMLPMLIILLYLWGSHLGQAVFSELKSLNKVFVSITASLLKILN